MISSLRWQHRQNNSILSLVPYQLLNQLLIHQFVFELFSLEHLGLTPLQPLYLHQANDFYEGMHIITNHQEVLLNKIPHKQFSLLLLFRNWCLLDTYLLSQDLQHAATVTLLLI